MKCSHVCTLSFVSETWEETGATFKGSYDSQSTTTVCPIGLIKYPEKNNLTNGLVWVPIPGHSLL